MFGKTTWSFKSCCFFLVILILSNAVLTLFNSGKLYDLSRVAKMKRTT